MKLDIQLFASASNSKSIYTNQYPSDHPFTLSTSFSESTIDKVNNYSRITLNASLGANNIRFSDNTGGTLYLYWHDNKNNTDVLITSKKVTKCGNTPSGSYGDATLTGTYDAYHKTDGTLSGYSKVVWDKQGTSAYMPNDNNVATANTTLTSIPRASAVSVTTANIGAKPTITITKASSSYTHTLRYYFTSDVQGTIVTKTTASSYTSWTLPTSLYAKIPNQNSITGTLYCDTFDGNNQLGTSQVSITANVPSTAIPNVPNEPALYDTDSISRNMGIYVQGKSKIRFTFTNCFSSNYSSTLKAYTLKINNVQVYSGSSSTYTMTTPLPNVNNTYELITVDSRDKSNTTGQKALTTTSYSNPAVSMFDATRLESPTTTVQVKFSGSISSLSNHNSKSFKIEYRKTTTSSWTTATTYTGTYSYTNQTYNVTNVDDSSTYIFRITATDSYGSTSIETSVGTSYTLLNFNANGQTMAINKASEKNDTFEVNLNTEITGDLTVSNGINIGQKNIFDLIYPIGSIYISANSTNPAILFGIGTWDPIEGQFLLGANSTYTAGSTGGEEKVTLTQNEMPAHKHDLAYGPAESGSATGYNYSLKLESGTNSTRGKGFPSNLGTFSMGGNQSHNNMPPYLAVYMWRRVS